MNDAPIIVVDGDDVLIDGGVVGSVAAITSSHRLQRIDGLFDRAKKIRTDWLTRSAERKVPDPPPNDDDARVSLRGWLNRLPVGRSGESISFADIDGAGSIAPGSAARLLPTVVAKFGGSWSVEDKSGAAIILRFPIRPRS